MTAFIEAGDWEAEIDASATDADVKRELTEALRRLEPLMRQILDYWKSPLLHKQSPTAARDEIQALYESVTDAFNGMRNLGDMASFYLSKNALNVAPSTLEFAAGGDDFNYPIRMIESHLYSYKYALELSLDQINLSANRSPKRSEKVDFVIRFVAFAFAENASSIVVDARPAGLFHSVTQHILDSLELECSNLRRSIARLLEEGRLP